MSNIFLLVKRVVTNNYIKYGWIILGIFIISRSLMLGSMYIGHTVFKSSTPLYSLLCQWDCGWYNYIVEHGYESEPIRRSHQSAASWAFFPALPMILRYSRQILDLLGNNADLFVVNSFLLAGLFVLYKYQRLSSSKNDAFFCLLLLAFSPCSIYFSIPYTESLSFLLTILVFYLASCNRWILAGLTGALLSSTKVIGVFIVFPMLLIALRKHSLKSLLKFDPETEKVLFALMLAPLGLFLYMIFLYYRVGDVFAFKHVQIAWLRQVGNPITILMGALVNPLDFKFYSACATVLGLLLTAYLARRNKYPEAVFLGISVLIPVSTGLASLPRYIFALFPVYVALELLTRDCPLQRHILLAGFSAICILVAILWSAPLTILA